MPERKRSGSYEVGDRSRMVDEGGWCPSRQIPVCMTALCCFIVYIIGSVITGVTYRGYSLNANCTYPDKSQTTEMFVYQTPLVVVGPCFMSAGGAVLLYLLFQWILCRPSLI